MKKFNKELNKDINGLKRLHMLKDKSEFKKMKLKIMAKHKISKATIYREMKKEVPGSYKNPNYKPPARRVTAEEMELVRGMLYRQKTIEQIRSEMESSLGESYSWDRIDLIRRKIEEQENEREQYSKGQSLKSISSKGMADNNGPEDTTGSENTASILAGMQNNRQTGGCIQFEYESPHGKDMKEFLLTVLRVDSMDPNTFITVPTGNYSVKLGYDAVKDIQRIIANSAAGKAYDVIEVAQINTKHLCAEQIRHFVNGRSHTIKEIREMKSILDEYKSQPSTMLDFEFIVDAVKHFAGEDVDREEIVLATNYMAKQREGISEKLLPDNKEVNRGIYKIMTENL